MKLRIFTALILVFCMMLSLVSCFDGNEEDSAYESEISENSIEASESSSQSYEPSDDELDESSSASDTSESKEEDNEVSNEEEEEEEEEKPEPKEEPSPKIVISGTYFSEEAISQGATVIDEEYASGIKFSLVNGVTPAKDFKVFHLDYIDYTENGGDGNFEVVYSDSSLEIGETVFLVISIAPFNWPYVGISYVDVNGKTRRFVIWESLRDGSLSLEELK